MDDDPTARRPCPYCAEDIAAAAIRCPHCRTRLTTFDPTAWRRDHPERKIAGAPSPVEHVLADGAAMLRRWRGGDPPAPFPGGRVA